MQLLHNIITGKGFSSINNPVSVKCSYILRFD